jgi:hypothetical protein
MKAESPKAIQRGWNKMQNTYMIDWTPGMFFAVSNLLLSFFPYPEVFGYGGGGDIVEPRS